MPLYPKNTAPAIDLALFRAPTAEYRGTPFWSWNCKLDRARLLEQIEHLKAMGMGGFHMHSRVGLATEYLGPEFMGHVKACVAKAKQEDMLAWLYDEDRWPSGAAGGIVTKDPQHRAKQLVWTIADRLDGKDELHHSGPATLIARHGVTMQGGRMAGYRRLADGEGARAGETVWHAYLRTTVRNSWYNNYTYLDTLSKPAVEAFIRSTHEKYRAEVGAD
nr:hypothetical protein [Planctomycetota bacterium]